jgi:hypothetical protein
MGIVVILVADRILFMIQLPGLLLGQGSSVFAHLLPLSAPQCPLLSFELLRLSWGERTVVEASSNTFLLTLFSAIDLSRRG